MVVSKPHHTYWSGSTLSFRLPKTSSWSFNPETGYHIALSIPTKTSFQVWPGFPARTALMLFPLFPLHPLLFCFTPCHHLSGSIPAGLTTLVVRQRVRNLMMKVWMTGGWGRWSLYLHHLFLHAGEFICQQMANPPAHCWLRLRHTTNGEFTSGSEPLTRVQGWMCHSPVAINGSVTNGALKLCHPSVGQHHKNCSHASTSFAGLATSESGSNVFSKIAKLNNV